jgi:predicted transcriptional regulator
VDEKRAETITLAADVIAAYVSNNAIAVADLPELIRNVHVRSLVWESRHQPRWSKPQPRSPPLRSGKASHPTF